MNFRPWTHEEDATLKRMAGEGKSYGDVAKVLNRNRNMVGGRAHRLGVLFPTSSEKQSRGSAAGAKKRWGN